MDSTTIYWITRCDYLHNVGFFGLALFTIVMIVNLLMCSIKCDNTYDNKDLSQYWKLLQKQIYRNLCCAVFCIFIPVFIPTSKEMAAIYILPKIVNNTQIQKEASDLYQLSKSYLESQISNKAKDNKESK